MSKNNENTPYYTGDAKFSPIPLTVSSPQIKAENKGKIKASSGNDQIANFAYRGLLNGEGVYVFDDIITTGAAIGRAANPDLKWETTRQFNIGTDLKILHTFDLTLNYFIKNTKDLLFQPDV